MNRSGVRLLTRAAQKALPSRDRKEAVGPAFMTSHLEPTLFPLETLHWTVKERSTQGTKGVFLSMKESDDIIVHYTVKGTEQN